jgi:iron complex transport system ATP-binding protein
VTLGGGDPHRLTPERRAAQVAYLAQERRIAWGMPALEVAALGAVSAPREIAQARALAALERVGMAEHAERGVFELSGGERARVLLARLLATQAKLLIADEPIAGLDPEAQLLTLELLKDQARQGSTVVATLHDLALAARFADQVLVLCDGCLEADGCFREALRPEVLWRVFRLEARWVDDPCGPLLAPCRRTSR